MSSHAHDKAEADETKRAAQLCDAPKERITPVSTSSPPRNTPTPELRERMERAAYWSRAFLLSRGLDDRLRLLIEFGLTDVDVARVMPSDVSPRSVRRWRTERAPMTRTAERWEPVDDLFALVGYFIANNTYDEEATVAWLRSRHRALDFERPLDALRAGRFEAVRAAAEEDLELLVAQQHELLPLPGMRDSGRVRS